MWAKSIWLETELAECPTWSWKEPSEGTEEKNSHTGRRDKAAACGNIHSKQSRNSFPHLIARLRFLLFSGRCWQHWDSCSTPHQPWKIPSEITASSAQAEAPELLLLAVRGHNTVQENTRPPATSRVGLLWCSMHRVHTVRTCRTYTVCSHLYLMSRKLWQRPTFCSWNSRCQTTSPLEWHFKFLWSNSSLTKHPEKMLYPLPVSWQVLVNISFPPFPSPNLLLLSAIVTKRF